MYIKKVEIKNIRSIAEFSMEFRHAEEAGWHVLIGDNGAGKSTVIRAIALGLIGPDLANGLYGYQDWNTWVPWNKENGSKVELTLVRDKQWDRPNTANSIQFYSTVELKKNTAGEVTPSGSISQIATLYGSNAGSGWFSAAYGPFRRLSGGNDEFNFIVAKRQRLAAHLSAFREDFALSHVIRLLKDYELDSRSNKKAANLLTQLIKFVNASGLLHHGAKIEKIDSKGLNIKDANGSIVALHDMSDGYRSILSMTLDILLRLCEVYSPQYVFKSNSNVIEIPGIILIDEIDAHLHPTWQTRIGQWFTQYFPNLQFIVTTHSPLICRACENGSIWRLAAPGSDQISGQVTGKDKDKLIYGDVLDAYETDVFGAKIARGEEGREKQEEYRGLVYKENYGLKMNAEEKKQLKHLKSIFHTDVAVEE